MRIDSPLLVRILFLGAYRRTVVIDPGKCYIEFSTRLFGRHRRRAVPFPEISRLDYRFVETGIHTGSAWLGSHDSTECFTLAIFLKKDWEHIMIGRFIAEGIVDHGPEGILAGDDAIDYRGDQQERSVGLVKLVRSMTGLPLTRFSAHCIADQPDHHVSASCRNGQGNLNSKNGLGEHERFVRD